MKLKLLAIVIIIPVFLNAQINIVRNVKSTAESLDQKVAADTTDKKWKHGGTFGLNASQTSLSNWASGGEDFSLSGNLILNLYEFYKKGKHSWDNVFDINLGYVQTTSLGVRKNTDKIELLSKYGYSISKKWNITGLFNLRTQLLDGFTYSNEETTFSSTFFSPAYLFLSVGFDFQPNKTFSLYMSPATSRWTIIGSKKLISKGLYGVDAGSNTKFNFGGYLMATYAKKISKILSYNGKVELFSNYIKNPQNVDLYFSNVVVLKFTKVFSASWTYDMIYDDDVKLFGKNNDSPALQVKSVLGAGIQLNF